ncbi:unnamed protein product [Paramecium sonneborni]|uniref:Uncharacterized protein n=1 Tax=Paramecium sonneborni TaxID=65129 RepID=A0A8S1RVL1_9CILI|nr:unnamed protein product [Paramecium sonneborni]
MDELIHIFLIKNQMKQNSLSISEDLEYVKGDLAKVQIVNLMIITLKIKVIFVSY